MEDIELLAWENRLFKASNFFTLIITHLFPEYGKTREHLKKSIVLHKTFLTVFSKKTFEEKYCPSQNIFNSVQQENI